MICTLCNDALIAGDGNAIFTAECTDSFHFSCITSYVKLGSQTCPTCIAEWKDIPSFGPASNPTGGLTPAPLQPRIPKRRINTRVITSQVPSSEPLVFNDDDPLDFQSSFSSNNISIIRSIDIKTHTEFPAVPRSVSQENFHILVNLKSNVTEIDQVNSDITCRAPIDLVTVLDISGSMTGTKIQLLKRAMGFVIENLGPSDRLSVISFSYNAHRLFPLLLMTDSGKQYALQAVNSLVAGGGTNIVEGLKKGSKVIEDRGHRNPVYSIMLLSDGQDSYTKEINLKEISRLQIPVHTFGFGADHDPIMLHSIAEGSKGTFSFIEAEGLIQDAFAQCIGGLLSVVVQDLQVHIQSLDPHLCLSQLKAGSYSTYLTGDNQTGSVDIGDLYADEERDFLVLVNIPVVADGNSNDQMKLVRVWCGYKDPFTKESVTTEAIEVKLERPEMVNEDTVVSIEVDRQKNRLQAAEAMSNSRAAAERGDLPTAWSIIDGCRMQISDTASAHAGDKFSVDLDLELQEVRSRMKSKKIYESTGRGYLLSGMSSHSRQMATTRGDSTESTYQTASMSKMLKKSAAYLPKSRGGTANDSNMAFKISSASSLKIQRGDITKWCINGTSDAIVNAANERMLGGAGLNGAIHSAGGPELQAACSTIAEVCPGIRCLKGEARITPAFKLPVSHVIHTVGPIYNVDNHPEVTLRNAYRNCLKLAKENKIEYIAFPAISCGYFGYPYDESATIAISTVMESDGDFKEVHFVLFEDDVFNSWEIGESLNSRSSIGIKIMGELDLKLICQSAQLRGFWDSEMHIGILLKLMARTSINFGIIYVYVRLLQELINEEDELLKCLRNEQGEKAYTAVVHALVELNEFNPGGKFPVPELWNFKENRRATAKEGVAALACNLSRTCTCNGAMIAGDGTAVFTAECSHSFHFNCINTYVRFGPSGNQICPTCGTKWKDIPVIRPAPGPILSPIPPPTGFCPYPLPPFGFPPSPFDFPPSPVHPSQITSPEPLVFNDDDPLNLQSNSSSENTSVIRSIDIKTHTELPAVKRSVSQENFHILVNLKSNVTGIDQVNSDTCRTPIDLVTVLDISGSMQGEKIQLLKRAMSFSSNARRLFPLLLMTDSGKQRALHAVNSLFASGNTNIVEGLKKGTKVIEDRRHKDPVCSIMLLSDGEDTCTYAKTISVKDISKLQIPVHTFGFGADHDSMMLHSIAESSRGTFSFIEAEGVIQDAFAQRIGGLLSVSVQDLQVHIQSLDPHLRINQLKAGSYSTDLTGDNRTGSVDFGDMYADEERDFLVLINIPVVTDENSNDQMKLVSVCCSYKDPFTKESVTTEAVEVKLQRPEMVNEEDMVVSIEVDRQKNRLQAAEAMSNSRAAAERGDLPRAWSIIDGCRMQMAETVSAYACDKFSADLDLELQEARSRMANQQMYESKGRGFLLSGATSHLTQMAAATGFSAMPMAQMVQKSRASGANCPPDTDNTH
ncbi:hypothetical protein C5167_019684 [Papaver somniferum]|uniref:Uncharacterized protein n=1 Tax=Papaver somniferum TaxID=3469 RepID=A0A4Y7IUU0_PAPSO|nr:hypothetical protein C5167_019684 [Papaver somniferum]